MTPKPARRDDRARRLESRRTAAPSSRASTSTRGSAFAPPWHIAFVAIVVLALVVLALNAMRWRPFLADDALISLRYADRLLHGGGLTWNDGERVEGYSNLLWVLLCAGLGAFGIDLVTATRVLGVVCSAGTVTCVAWTFARPGFGDALAALAAAMVVAVASPIGVWAIGGLESTLVAFLLAAAFMVLAPVATATRDETGAVSDIADRRRVWLASALLGLLCITRPDGIVLAFAVIAAFVVARGWSGETPRIALALAAGPLALTVAQLAFRLTYYGEWIANSARVKLAFSWIRARSGALYVIDGLVGFASLLLLFALGGFAARRGGHRGLGRFVLVAAFVWVAYVIAIGGDFFPGRRFFVPLVVLFGFGTGLAVRAFRSRWPGIVGPALAAMLIAMYAFLQWNDPAALRARDERWEWEGREVGQFLARAFGERKPLIAVDPAGSVPYWSRLPSIDMLGLSDKYIAHHPPAGFGSGKTGHELGDGKYVLSREPDFVILCLPAGRDTGCFRSGKELVADSEFLRRYALVNYQTDGAQPVLTRIWTRREGGAVGIRRTPDRIEIPGWQFAGNPETVMRRGSEGRLGPIVEGVESARLEIDVPPGAWAAVGRSTAAGGRWTLRALEPGASDRSTVVGAGIDSARFQSPGGRMELTWTSDHPTLLFDVILKREANEAGR